jgi:hypothetical protein
MSSVAEVSIIYWFPLKPHLTIKPQIKVTVEYGIPS